MRTKLFVVTIAVFAATGCSVSIGGNGSAPTPQPKQNSSAAPAQNQVGAAPAPVAPAAPAPAAASATEDRVSLIGNWGRDGNCDRLVRLSADNRVFDGTGVLVGDWGIQAQPNSRFDLISANIGGEPYEMEVEVIDSNHLRMRPTNGNPSFTWDRC